jgi:tetratricopeptide (TPR) repeat protein
MKRILCAFLLLVCAPAAMPAEVPAALKEARQLWLKGNYGEAREQYEALLKDDKLRTAATIGLSRALQSEGEYDKAVAVVASALKDSTRVPAYADLLARHAELLHLRGRWDEAEKQAEAALAVKKDHFLARWVLAQVYRDRGDFKKAGDACVWFVRTYNDRSGTDDEVKDPDDLLIVCLAGAEHARWNKLSDQLKYIVEEIYPDVLKADRNFWPAEYHSGMLLLEKYNKPEALDAFDKALKINSSAAEVLTGKGAIALMEFKIKDAERFAEQALKINPKLPEALRLRADVHLAGGDATAALRELEQARTVSPRDERTLGRIAAGLLLQKKKDDFEALAKAVEKFDPKPALFYFELGDRMEDRRYFDDAEKYFRKSAELRPNLAGPANSLGMLYMRLGREKEAREQLDRGFKIDPFNVRVSNLRKVLDHLKKYETIKTDHFELRFDPEHDALQARYMALYLEEIYADLAEKFQYRPRGPILIEVFNSHEMFSGRTVALPDLHTIGACTGRMIAMASPHARGIRHPFNWARVLRHEIVHIFNLEQTHFLVPHWLTEGLAVGNEGFPRPSRWNQLLRERAAAGNLMDLDNIDLGFIRPTTPDDWHMAYCQSQIYVDCIRAKYGPAAIGELLAAYADGLNTAAAITKVCKVDKAAFEKTYREYLDELVKTLQQGKPPQKPKTTKELQEAWEKNGDPDAGAELALRLLARDRKGARKLAEQVLAAKKNHPVAEYVMARLANLAGDEKQERSRLESIADKASEPRVLRALGKIYYEEKEFDKAAEMYELGRKAEPFESEWLARLVQVYAQKEDKPKLIGVLEDLVPTDADDFEQRLRLAKLLAETGRAAEAEKYARQALEIDLRSEEARNVLLKALEAQKKDAEAQKLRGVFEKK